MTKSRLPPIGFWSYVRRDDDLSRGRVSELRELILAELESQLGQEVPVFKDTVSIAPGARWNEQTTQALSDATFFIPVLTPSFLQSEWCCREVRLFLERQKRLLEAYPDLPAVSRIFPIHYVDVTDADARDEEVRDTLMELQHLNFHGMRHRPGDDPVVQTEVARFVTAIRNMLRHRVEISDGSPPGVEKTGPPTTQRRKARQPKRPVPVDHGLDVILTDHGPSKIVTTREVQAIAGVTVREAMAIVDGLPWPIAKGVSIDEAMKIMARIEAQGGTVNLRARTTPAEDDPRPLAPSPMAEPKPVGPPPPGDWASGPTSPPGSSKAPMIIGGIIAVILLLMVLTVANQPSAYSGDTTNYYADNVIGNDSLMDDNLMTDANMGTAATTTTNTGEVSSSNTTSALDNTVDTVAPSSTSNVLVKNNCSRQMDFYLSYQSRKFDTGWADAGPWHFSAGENSSLYAGGVPLQAEGGEFNYYARSPDGTAEVQGQDYYTFSGGRGRFPTRHVYLSPNSSGMYVISLDCQ